MILIFVAIGMVSFASALHGAMTANDEGGRDLTGRLMHVIAALLLTGAWGLGHESGTGWAALAVASAMELGLRARTQAIEKKVAQAAAAREALAASVTTPGTPEEDRAPIRAATARERVLDSPVVHPSPPPFVTIVLLREAHQVSGDVFVASLRRSGRRDAAVMTSAQGSGRGAVTQATGAGSGTAGTARSGAAWQATVGPFTLEVTNQRSPLAAAQLAEAAGQSFDWPEAMGICRDHTTSVRIATRTAGLTPRSEVVAMHMQAHAAISEFAPTCGVLWEAARLLRPVTARIDVNPTADTSDGSNAASPQAARRAMEACVNFRVTPGETSPDGSAKMISDTVGLCAFGLPDIEIQTAGEPDERVSAVLYHLAETFFAQGCDWQDGDERDVCNYGRWRCERRRASLAPMREVLAMAPVT